MNIVVTGCNGFIGKNICEWLKKKGYKVIGIGQEDTFHKYIDQYIKSDISSSSFIDEIIAKIDACSVIVHTAAVLSKDNFNQALIEVNCIGALNVFKVATKIRCNLLINISGAPIIGFPMMHPISEEHFVSPRSLYHATKVMQEYIFNLAEIYGIRSVQLRVPSPIGTGMNPKTILSVFLENCLKNEPISILGKGSRRQNYIDVRDIATYVIKCIENQNVHGCYNIGVSDTISNLELAEMCKRISMSNSEIKFSGSEDPEEGVIWDYSTEKAIRELKFVPEYTLEDTIKLIIEKKRNLN